MKYRKRFVIFNLLAGLMVWMGGCKQQPSFELIRKIDLLTFPSASSIAIHNNELFIIGDDAPFILVTDTGFTNYKAVRFLPDTSFRIAKDIKFDLEASFIFQKGSPTLYSFGSFASARREQVLLFSLPSLTLIDSVGPSFKSMFPKTEELNIEGAAMLKSDVVLANRGNLANPNNHLMILGYSKSGIGRQIRLQIDAESFVGVSGLDYLLEEDILLFTGSQEATASTTADGAIGQSYLGWINNFSQRIEDSVIHPDYTVELSTINSSFNKKKVESVAAQKIEEGKYFLYLVSDDDAGHSEVYKLFINF